MKRISGFIAGLLFGMGILLSGMANPAKVLGFLDKVAPPGLVDRLRGLRPCPRWRCPLGTPALAAVRLGGQAGGLRPSTAPTRIGLGRSRRVKAKPLRGRCASLDPPSTWCPTGKRSAQAAGRRH